MSFTDGVFPLGMSWVALVPACPFLAAIILALAPSWRVGAWINFGSCCLCLVLAGLLAGQVGDAPAEPVATWLLVDGLSVYMVGLTSFVAMTTAWFSLSYIRGEVAARRLDRRRLRLYHAMYQVFLGGMLLALLSNNLGVAWVGMETATIAAVLVVGLPRTHSAIEASWKYFLICGVGIALALFGTIMLYLAATPAVGVGLGAMSWTTITAAASRCDGQVLNLAFVFLLLGYGTKAGLAPLHSWIPDAHAEGPTPVSAVLSGSILNVALVMILRLRNVLSKNPGAIDPGPPILALGLVSVLFAAFSLWHRRDVKRFFAFSSIEQSGLTAFAFGLGGSGAIFAGVLHMTLHTLTKAAIFQCVGRAAQLRGSQRFADIGGLITTNRRLGLTLAAGMVAIVGLPPFGLFAADFLIITETVRHRMLLALPLSIGLVVGGWAMMLRLQTLCLGPPNNVASLRIVPVSALHLAPVWLHLAMVLVLGLAMPTYVVDWLLTIARAMK